MTNNFNNKEEFLAAYKAACEKHEKIENSIVKIMYLIEIDDDNKDLEPALKEMENISEKLYDSIYDMRMEGEKLGWLEPYRPRICMHAF